MGYRLYKRVYRALYSIFFSRKLSSRPRFSIAGSTWILEEITIMKSIEVPFFVDQIICSPLCSWFFITFFLGSPYDGRHGAHPSSIVPGSEDRWLPRNHAMSYVAGILVTALGGHWTCLWPMWPMWLCRRCMTICINIDIEWYRCIDIRICIS